MKRATFLPGATAMVTPHRSDYSEFKAHWRALVGCTFAASIGTIGLNAYTNGAFLPELTTKAGYTREQISFAVLLLSLTVAVVAPLAGQLIDRWGAMRVIAVSVIGEAIGFALLGTMPAQFGWFTAGMIVLALLGVGTTPPSFSRVIAARFNLRRGLALGIMISGLGIMAISAPLVMTHVIAATGWRGGYWALALLVLVLGGGGYWLIHMDGPAADEKPGRDADRDGLGGWSALRRPLLWYLLLCFAAPALFGGGYLLHLVTIPRQRGFTPNEAAQVQALVGVAIVVGRFTSGFAMDRIFAPFVAAIAFAISSAGAAMLLSSSGPILCLAALATGLTIGAEVDILAYTASRYFGLASFGRLYSLAYSMMILAGGTSPLLITTLSPGGDYRPAILTSTIGLLAAAIAVSMLPRFKTGTYPAW